jgi:radical SAM-linked protein
MRTLQRIIRRSGIPVEYSKGFNPHMDLSIAQPLSVGIYSEGEYMDVVLTKELECGYIKDALNEKAPEGIRIMDVAMVRPDPTGKKVPQCMALIDAAAYVITLKYNSTENLQKEVNALIEKDQWVTLKKSKSGEKSVDIKTMIKKLNFSIDNNLLLIDTILSSGSRENLTPELLASYIKENTSDVNTGAFVDIIRKDMYKQNGEALISLNDFFRSV